MKAQFQSSEQIQVRFPPFIDFTTGRHIIGTDTATMSLRKGDGTTQTGVALSWDSVVHLWYVDLTPSLPTEAGEWRFKASSSDSNAFAQWKILHIGDYIDHLDIETSTRATQAQILSDATPFPGARIDAAVSTRATQAQILSDATPFQGARIDAAVSTRATQAQILSDATPLAGANVNALTTTRSSYLDKLNITGNVASSAEVLSLQNNTSTRISLPSQLERPESGSSTFILDLYLYDSDGNMEDPDATPTLTVVNEVGTDRSGNLTNSGVLQHIGLGHYRIGYVVSSSHAEEQLRFEFTIVEGGLTRIAGSSSVVVDVVDVHFSETDRDNIESIMERTDNLPDDPATETTTQAAVDAAVDAKDAAEAVGSDSVITRKMIANGWKVQGTQLLVYDDDGHTIYKLFNLYDESRDPSGTRVFERVPV